MSISCRVRGLGLCVRWVGGYEATARALIRAGAMRNCTGRARNRKQEQSNGACTSASVVYFCAPHTVKGVRVYQTVTLTKAAPAQESAPGTGWAHAKAASVRAPWTKGRTRTACAVATAGGTVSTQMDRRMEVHRGGGGAHLGLWGAQGLPQHAQHQRVGGARASVQEQVHD